jgi:uncharacterized secreted protein with C-terminal beta-propeller domain
MVLATPGFDYTQEQSDYVYYIYMLVVDLSRASSQIRAVGQVPGLLLNSYALDVMDDTVCIGTTVQSAVSNTTTGLNMTKATNYISTLQIPASSGSSLPSTMDIVGQLELSKNGEDFSFVRIFDNVAYAAVPRYENMTFYVMDLLDPVDPQVLGVANLIGSLEFMYPINDDNTLLITVGQATNENALNLGLQISVLDARDGTKPTVAQRYTVPSLLGNGYSTSFVIYEYKSFRYDPRTERLIIPNTRFFFDGYYVFVINENEITPTCRISSIPYNDGQTAVCYCSYLPWRSMIFNGNVTTMGDHFIQSTDPNTCANKWNRTITVTDPKNCCGSGTF